MQSPARPAGHDQCNITAPAASAAVCVAVVARFHDTLADVDTVIYVYTARNQRAQPRLTFRLPARALGVVAVLLTAPQLLPASSGRVDNQPMFARVKVEVPEHNGRPAQMHVATTTFVLPPWEQVSQNGWPLSLRGCSSQASVSGFDTHRDSMTSRLDCRTRASRRTRLLSCLPRRPPLHRPKRWNGRTVGCRQIIPCCRSCSTPTAPTPSSWGGSGSTARRGGAWRPGPSRT